MGFTKILCPTDFSAGADRALRVAANLASQMQAELVIAHAWYIPPSGYFPAAPFPANVIEEIVQDAEQGLGVAVRSAVAAGAERVRGTLLSGVPWAEIVGLLEHQAFDLCVVGTHGRTGLARVLLGSVAEKVLRHSPCSTLAVRPETEVKPFTHVLVPTDFSSSARYALDLAATLVHPLGTITLLHVLELPIKYSGEVANPELAQSLQEAAGDALEHAAELVRRQCRAKVTVCSGSGHAGAQTLAFVERDPSIDLVVMGSHGRTGIMRALLGSVAEKVVRHARCPVLVARTKA